MVCHWGLQPVSRSGDVAAGAAGTGSKNRQQEQQAARAKADRLQDLYLSYLTRDVCIPPISDKREG